MSARRCPVKHYDWGKVGSNSLVARLIKAKNYVEVDENKPYAEVINPIVFLLFESCFIFSYLLNFIVTTALDE